MNRIEGKSPYIYMFLIESYRIINNNNKYIINNNYNNNKYIKYINYKIIFTSS